MSTAISKIFWLLSFVVERSGDYHILLQPMMKADISKDIYILVESSPMKDTKCHLGFHTFICGFEAFIKLFIKSLDFLFLLKLHRC